MPDTKSRLDEVQNRRDLIQVMESSMTASANAIKETGKYAAGRNPVKSFLIESNTSLGNFDSFDKTISVKTKPTKDSGLHYMELVTKPKRGNKRTGKYILETPEKRFWVFHSLDRSDIVDSQMRYLIERSMSGLDYFWFSEPLLKNFADEGKMKEFSAGIDSELPDDVIDFIGHMSIRVWGKESEFALDALQDAPHVERSVSLKAVTSRFVLDSDNGSNIYADERLTTFGKLTSQGTSAILHMTIISKLIKTYKKELGILERKIGKKEKTVLDMKPFLIKPRKGEIANVKALVVRLVHNMPKMRIIGFPTRVSENFYRIPSVDLHNGDKVDLEVFPGGIRVILWPKSCGNTVLRLESNIQQHLRADLERKN